MKPIPRPGIVYDGENFNEIQDRNQANSFWFSKFFPSRQKDYSISIDTNLNRKIRSAVAGLNGLEFSSQFERYCSGAGSQPCTCYYPDFPNITQFEFGTDGATKNVSGTAMEQDLETVMILGPLVIT